MCVVYVSPVCTNPCFCMKYYSLIQLYIGFCSWPEREIRFWGSGFSRVSAQSKFLVLVKLKLGVFFFFFLLLLLSLVRLSWDLWSSGFFSLSGFLYFELDRFGNWGCGMNWLTGWKVWFFYFFFAVFWLVYLGLGLRRSSADEAEVNCVC